MGELPDWYEYREVCRWLRTDPLPFYTAPYSGFWYVKGVEGLNAEARAADLRQQFEAATRAAGHRR